MTHFFHRAPSVTRALRLLVLLLAPLGATLALADDYTDVKTLLRSGKPTEAMAKAEAYLSGKPRDPQMRFIKGVIQAESGKITDAIATFAKLTEDNPELPEPYNNLAVLYANQSQFDKARAALEMAIRTNPSYATAHENLGDVYAKLASQAYSKALQLDASNTAVQPKLALIRDLFAPGSKAIGKPVAATATAPAVAAKPVAPVTPAQAAAKPAVPAVAAAAPVAPAPAISAPAVAAPATGGSDKEVESAVKAWASAWSAKNLNGYLGAYHASFTPSGNQSRKAWEEERRARILGKSQINVTLTDMQIKINGDKATAQFKQDYRADSLSVSSRKTLALTKTNSGWAIVRESTGG